MSGRQVVVWDSPDPPVSATAQATTVIHWSGYGKLGGALTVPSYLEENGQRLRARYVAFIHDLGQRIVAGRRIVDALAVHPGVSLWWMSLLAEKNPFKSKRIFDCLRLLALEEMLAAAAPKRVRLISADDDLTEALDGLCAHLGIGFERERIAVASRQHPARSLFLAVPSPMQGLLWLAQHLAKRWSLRHSAAAPWTNGESSVFLFSYFTNLRPVTESDDSFHSSYWEALPGKLRDAGIGRNWVHHYLPSTQIPDARAARRRLDQLNRDTHRQGAHALVDQYLSPSLVWRALGTWRRLWRARLRMRDINQAFVPRDSAVSLWPLLRRDWHASLTGHVGMQNALWLELFDSIMASIPRHRLGLYLSENQGWERAFVAAWRAHGHGKLVAVVHSTIRFWDLRHVDDVRSLSRGSVHDLPLPDLVALNGPAAWESYQQTDYPVDQLAPAEALRYLGLATRATKEPSGDSRGIGRPIRVLVLGDIFPSATRRMLHLLDAARKLANVPMEFTVKPHPTNPVNPADHPGLCLRLVTEPLPKILGSFDVAVAGNSTSSALDAHLAGLRVIVHLDQNDFNFTPLRDVKGVHTVSTPESLVVALQECPEHQASGSWEGFFWLDRALPRWRRLLSSLGFSMVDHTN